MTLTTPRPSGGALTTRDVDAGSGNPRPGLQVLEVYGLSDLIMAGGYEK